MMVHDNSRETIITNRVSPAPFTPAENTIYIPSNREYTATKRSSTTHTRHTGAKLSASAPEANGIRKRCGSNTYPVAITPM